MMIDFRYLFAKFNIQPIGILHVGANTCQEKDIYEELKVPKVLWIEAIPLVYEIAKIGLEKYPNQKILNYCIGDEDEKEVEFNLSNNEYQSSSYLEFGVHQTIHPTVHFIDKVKMKTKRLDTLNKELNLNLENYDFINFDIQGAELQALKGMGELLHNVRYAYLEVNKKETYLGGALVYEIDEYLSKFGLIRVETSKYVGESWADALYCKKI